MAIVPWPPESTGPRRASSARPFLRAALAAIAGGVAAASLALLPGCTARPEAPHGFRFEEVSAEAGLRSFLHTDGSSGNYYITETLASGVVLFDWDQDGDLDLYFPNGRPLPPSEEGDASTSNALFRNDGVSGGIPRFTDVTSEAGVGGVGFSVGACAADVDGDGDLDLYVTGLGHNVLYRNGGPEAGHRFEDITEEAGCDDERFSAGCCFLDIDGDADLDLYVSNYVVEEFEAAEPCVYNGVRGYCAPGQYEPVPDSLFENDGRGHFRDISDSSGIRDTKPRWGLAVVSSDFDEDGRPDIYVANDRTDNFLFINQGEGRFVEKGIEWGAALSIDGDEQGSMGVALGDFDGDGHFDMLVTNYQKQLNALYHSRGAEGFRDEALSRGIGEFCLPLVSWGTEFRDFDHDGWVDLFVASGHLEDNIAHYDQSSTYLQPNQVFLNRGGKRFEDVSAEAGDAMKERKSTRGAAFGDIDNDGDIDVVLVNSRDRPSLLLNRGANARPWVMFDLRGKKNRFAIGARVRIEAGGRSQVREVRSAGSYASQNDHRVHFGLGAAEVVDRVEVTWPGGGKTTREHLPARKLYRLEEE